MENLLKNLEELREKIIVTMAMLDIEKKRVELADLRIKANKPDFWNNQAKAVATKRKIEELVTE
ncbi:MAG: hypothetical protein NTW06_02125, partial [Candidatus Falkowbacteria bacterium]|nr:hypothetical protein [Candidatus Falkowbacteria bacterium]